MEGEAKALPAYLRQRFHGWRATRFSEYRGWYRRLAEEGQRPRAMIISCCDSRVDVVGMFGAEQGELFVHRNIASLVPPFNPAGDVHGTSAAVEYAVTALRVAHLIVNTHSYCGGVAGCIGMCSGKAPQLKHQTSFVGRWLEILQPGYERVKDRPEAEIQEALEKEAVKVSLDNLRSFPFVREAVDAGDLTLHGLWTDIAEGALHELTGQGKFTPV